MGALVSGGYQSSNTSGSYTNTGTTAQQGQTAGTASTAKTLTPFQQNLQNPLFSYASTLLSNPTSVTAPIAAQNRDQTSGTYSGLADSLRQQFASGTSGGGSGKYGQAVLQGNLARAGSLNQADLTAGTNAVQAQSAGSQLGANLLSQDFGSTSNQQGTTSGTATSTGSGTSKGSSSGFNIGASAGASFNPATATWGA